MKELTEGIVSIGKELASSEVLTPDERAQMVAWTAALGVAIAKREHLKAENYRIALSTMFGVAEVRAARASEKALLKMADLALSTLVKIGIAALA